MAIGDGKEVFLLDEWVPIMIISSDQSWTLRTCRAILAPNLSVPLLLGGPFLASNSLVIDHELRTCIDKKCGFDLLNPVSIRKSVVKPKPRFRPELVKLQKKGELIKQDYIDVFPPDIPDTAELPDDVLMKIKLRNDVTPMVARAYSCPKKYRASWKTLIEQHLAAGRIRPSNSDYVSPAFIVLKADPNVLPRWVNNYRKLNLNTVADNHPLPLVEDILHNCATRKFYGKIDMMN